MHAIILGAKANHDVTGHMRIIHETHRLYANFNGDSRYNVMIANSILADSTFILQAGQITVDVLADIPNRRVNPLSPSSPPAAAMRFFQLGNAE